MNKRRIGITIAAISVTVMLCLLGFSACSSGCDHLKKFYVTGNSATCTENGNIACWYCYDCGKFFNESGEMLTESNIYIPSSGGHNWGNWRKDTDDCTKGGVSYRTCKNCGAKEKKPLEPGEHYIKSTWSFDDDEHWHGCSVCGMCLETEPHRYDEDGDCICGYNIYDAMDNEFEFEENYDGTWTIAEYLGEETAVSIPQVYRGGAVTEIGYGAFDNSDVRTVELPDSLLSIGAYAFRGTALTEIVIPSGVTEIGEYAFGDCDSLESVTIPFVGERADHSGRTHFGYIFGASYASDNEYYVPDSLQDVVVTGGEVIAEDAFYGCGNLTSVTLPDSVTSIGNGAFKECYGLTEITLSGGLTGMAFDAFVGCTAIETATMPAFAVEYIPQDSLKTVVLTSGESIPAEAFYNCDTLTSVTIPSSVTEVGENAFYG